jgi:hypothetical protein
VTSEGRRNSVVSGLAVLSLRGILLWLVVPLSVIAWIFVGFQLRGRDVTLGQFLGWIDLNLIALLQRGVLRPLVRHPADWVPVAALPEVRHRLRGTDPV